MIEDMKQALEALELVSTEFVCNGAHHAKKDRHELGEPCPIVERYEKAITSLRQAIAEFDSHTLYREGYVNGYAFGEAAGKRQAIKELESQEPVAWMHIMDNTEGIKANGAGIVSITQKRKHPFGKVGIDFSKSYPVTSTPLYTHPPQRTWLSLTDEQVEKIIKSNMSFQMNLAGIRQDFEAAHGIKE